MNTEPRLWQLITWPTAQVLIGFALSQRYGWAWDTVIVLLSLCLMATFTAVYILLSAFEQVLRAQGYEAVVNPIRQPVTVNLNQMTTSKVVVDTERMFCRALLEFGDDITEATWLRGRWQSLGGVGRSDFIACKDRLTRLGALARVNPAAKNSPHRVADRRILEHRASHPSPASSFPTVTFGGFKRGSK